MGCGASKSLEGKLVITETASELEISRLRDAIKKNDLFLFNRYSGYDKLSENYGMRGETLTCLHLAASYDSYVILGHILKYINDLYPAKFQSTVNIQDKDKRTPAMMAVQNDHVLSFSILFKYKACDFIVRDQEGKNLKDYINNSTDCKEYFEENSKPKSIPKAPEIERPQYRQQKTKSSRILHPSEVSGNADPIFQKLNSKSAAYEVYKKCLDSNQPFVDSEFPAKLESITTNKSNKYYDYYSKSVWRRPHEFMKMDHSQLRIFDQVDPNDIIQGRLGVSYFLSCLSSLAEFPSRLLDNFIIKDVNRFGVYCVRFYHNGVPTEIVIDDYFPCQGEDPDKPLFSSVKGKELWVIIIEKAWAKMFKQYSNAEKGDPAWAFQNLSPAPAFTYETQNYELEELMEILTEADKKNWMCVAMCKPQNKSISGEGLVENHAYSLIGVYHIDGIQLVKLRNPWGMTEYKGDYSDTSDKWTDQMKKTVGLIQANDGIFFMTLEDFKKNYSSFTLSYYRDDWGYHYEKVEMSPNHAMYFEFEIKESTYASFRVHQPDEKSQKTINPDYQVSPSEITVSLIKGNGSLADVLSADNKDTDYKNKQGIVNLRKLGKSVLLPSGRYMLRSKVAWVSGKEEAYTVSVYSSKKIDLKYPDEKFTGYFKKRIQNVIKEEDLKVIKEGVWHTSGWYDSKVFYFHVTNKGSKHYEMNWSIKSTENLKIKKVSTITSPSTVKLVLEPGQSETITVKRLNPSLNTSVDFEWTDTYT